MAEVVIVDGVAIAVLKLATIPFSLPIPLHPAERYYREIGVLK